VVYRLSSSRFAANDGTGAALYGGRWNPIGIPAIYTSQSRSLAALEILVHFDVLPRDFVLTEISFPDALPVLEVKTEELPSGWDANVIPAEAQKIGRQFAEDLRFAVLSVPSMVIPWERNFVLNPHHADFGSIVFGPSTPFRFDPRLK
jgi:RES domain-containing protein